MMCDLRLAITGFWAGATFDLICRQLPSPIHRKFRLVEDRERPHVLLFGPFLDGRWQNGMPSPPATDALTIFMTGENVAPDLSRCDYAVSFSRGIDSPRHMRVPNWVHRMRAHGLSPRSLLS